MGLQLFSQRSWEEDSFNETNVTSVLRNAQEMVCNKGDLKKKTFLPSIEIAKTGKKIK